MENIQSLSESEAFIIQGLTLTGSVFRPSDWAERMCDALSEFQGRRVCYSPLLVPMNYHGYRSVLVRHALQQKYPDLYDEILYFAKSNQLKIVQNIDPNLLEA